MAKRKLVSAKPENPVAFTEYMQSLAQRECHETNEEIRVRFDTPELRRDLANFIQVIGAIRLNQWNPPTQPLDKDDS